MDTEASAPLLDSVHCAEGEAADVCWTPDPRERQQQRVGQALRRLQQWLLEMYRHGYAQEDGEGLVRLSEAVSARFALGLLRHGEGAFLVMPDLEASWARVVPWRHAVMRAGDPTLYLVTETIEIDGELAPDFGISFHIPDPAKALALGQRKTLQLRRFMQGASGWSVDPDPFAQMPIALLAHNAPIFHTARKLKSAGRKRGR